jgi:large subunit ribosomal protein L18
MLETKRKRISRHKRVRAKISGTKDTPRLCVFCSNSHIYAQLINDQKGIILASTNDSKIKIAAKDKGAKKEQARSGKTEAAFLVGKAIAIIAMEKKIDKVVFDRGGFKYHGVIKALADGAREAGLKF